MHKCLAQQGFSTDLLVSNSSSPRPGCGERIWCAVTTFYVYNSWSRLIFPSTTALHLPRHLVHSLRGILRHYNPRFSERETHACTSACLPQGVNQALAPRTPSRMGKNAAELVPFAATVSRSCGLTIQRPKRGLKSDFSDS